jgi:hypothetical protein
MQEISTWNLQPVNDFIETVFRQSTDDIFETFKFFNVS